jgi:pimeloyl-ACP methyl ester carboxylesterase
MKRPRTTHFARNKGLAIAADVGGEPGAPCLVLMHGGGQTRHAWSRGFRELVAAGYHVVSLDARGHGESEWARDGDYSLDTLCGDLLAVLQGIGGKPVLVGASMGGTVSLVTLGDHPEVASALVLVDVAPRLEMTGVEHILEFMRGHPSGFATIDEAADAIAAYNPHRPRPKDQAGLAKNLRQRDGRWHWHWDPAFVAGDYRTIVGNLSARMREAASRITVPTLLVRGMSSDVVSHEGVDELSRLIPHLEFVDIAGAGHMVAGDRNDAFNAAILDFLKRHPEAGR